MVMPAISERCNSNPWILSAAGRASVLTAERLNPFVRRVIKRACLERRAWLQRVERSCVPVCG